jgi:hypothetical protein
MLRRTTPGPLLQFWIAWILRFRVQKSMHRTTIELQAPLPMPSKTTLLSNYPAIRTSDPEQARGRIFFLFGATSFEVPGRGPDLRRANDLEVGDLRLYY